MPEIFRRYIDAFRQRPRRKRVGPDVHCQIKADAGYAGNQRQQVIAFLVAHEGQVVVVFAEYGGCLGEQHDSAGFFGLYPLILYAQTFSPLGFKSY